MILHILAPLISKFAPVLATALGSPIAGIVTSLIASAFGGDPKNLPDLVSKIGADTESQNKLAQLELDHGDLIKTLLITRPPTKIDLHVIVSYDTESQNG